MKNYKVCLIGNIIFDEIFWLNNFTSNQPNKCIKSFESVGAIGNVLRGMQHLNFKQDIQINSNTANDIHGLFIKENMHGKNIYSYIKDIPGRKTSKAKIIIDLNNKTKTSIVEWGACSQMTDFIIKNNEWNHIMYIDILENLKSADLQNINQGIISADMCSNTLDDKNRNRILSLLPYIDYLILSIDELNALSKTKGFKNKLTDISKKIKKYLIVRSLTYIYIINNQGKLHIIKNIKIKKKQLDILGIGDFFASAFITKCINDGKFNIKSNIKYCIKETNRFLSQDINLKYK